jgi:hypothetical protein
VDEQLVQSRRADDSALYSRPLISRRRMSVISKAIRRACEKTAANTHTLQPGWPWPLPGRATVTRPLLFCVC